MVLWTMVDIPHNRLLITEEERRCVDSVLQSGWIARGEQSNALEKEFSTFFGRGDSCLLSSATAGLFLSLKLLGVSEGQFVAVPTYVCSALLNAIHMANARPLIVDIKQDDLNICPDSLSERSSGTPLVATFAVHTYGVPSDIDALRPIGGAIIEDCCQALGGESRGRKLGTIGDLSVFSFHATKIITCGHGGLIHDPQSAFAQAAKDYIDFDCRDTYEPRFNFFMSDIEAAMLRPQLSRIQTIMDQRKKIAERYLHVLPQGISVVGAPFAINQMIYRFVLRFSDMKNRDNAQCIFKKNGIKTIVPLTREELLHRYLNLDPALYPNAEHCVDTTLSLPLYPALDGSEIDRICDTLGSI